MRSVTNFRKRNQIPCVELFAMKTRLEQIVGYGEKYQYGQPTVAVSRDRRKDNRHGG